MESGDIVAGDDKGSVRCYSVSVEGEYYMSSEFVAHTSPVNALLVLGDGTIGKKHKCLKNIGPRIALSFHILNSFHENFLNYKIS